MATENPLQEWNSFIEGLKHARVSSVSLTTDQQELFYQLIRRNFLPQVLELSDLVASKGKEYPLFGEKTYYGHTTRTGTAGERDYLTFSIHRSIRPNSIVVDDTEIGQSTTGFFAYNGMVGPRFDILDPQIAVFINPDSGATILVNSREAMFTPIRSHRLYPLGSAADWFSILAQKDMLARMRGELSDLPDLRDVANP